MLHGVCSSLLTLRLSSCICHRALGCTPPPRILLLHTTSCQRDGGGFCPRRAENCIQTIGGPSKFAEIVGAQSRSRAQFPSEVSHAGGPGQVVPRQRGTAKFLGRPSVGERSDVRQPRACGKSRHRASPALWVATARMMMVMLMIRGGDDGEEDGEEACHMWRFSFSPR